MTRVKGDALPKVSGEGYPNENGDELIQQKLRPAEIAAKIHVRVDASGKALEKLPLGWMEAGWMKGDDGFNLMHPI